MTDEPQPGGAGDPPARSGHDNVDGSGEPRTLQNADRPAEAPASQAEDTSDDATTGPEAWNPRQLLVTLTVFYGVFVLIGLGIRWLHFGTPLHTADLRLDNLTGPLQWHDPGLIWPLAIAALIALAGIAGQSVMARMEWGRELVRVVKTMMGPRPTWWLALACGLSSGVGEEVLFRGALQPALGELGWLWATLIFAALHAFNMRAGDDPDRAKKVAALPLPRRLWVRHGWGLFALCFGFLLAGLYEWSQSLWPPTLMHVLLNGVNIYRIARNDESATITPTDTETEPGA